jgi:histidinol dehydrogenase
MLQQSDNLACKLRAAVLVNDHEKATLLTVEYTEALRQHWTLLSAPERAASSIPKQSLALLNWVREMTLMQQAMAAEHLSIVEKASRYQTARALYLQSAALDLQR